MIRHYVFHLEGRQFQNNNSMEQFIGVHLATFSPANEIWDDLSKLYMHPKFARRHPLKLKGEKFGTVLDDH